MLYYELLIAIGYAVSTHYLSVYHSLTESDSADYAEIQSALDRLRDARDWVDHEIVIRKINMEWATTGAGNDH